MSCQLRIERKAQGQNLVYPELETTNLDNQAFTRPCPVSEAANVHSREIIYHRLLLLCTGSSGERAQSICDVEPSNIQQTSIGSQSSRLTRTHHGSHDNDREGHGRPSLGRINAR